MKKAIESYNDMGISSELDMHRITHLMKLGLIFSLICISADIILGCGSASAVEYGLPPAFARYLSVSDGRIFWSAIIGLIGIPIECLCYFSIYRLIAFQSPKYAHMYRSGIIGCLIFGDCVHVSCCALAYFMKKISVYDPENVLNMSLEFAGYFLLPATFLCCAYCGADQGICGRTDSAAETGLDIFSPVRNNCSRYSETARSGVYKRPCGGMDKLRQSLDVLRTACYYKKMRYKRKVIMVIREYGDNSLPKIILLHPMLADGNIMLSLTEGMSGKYCFIAPDLSGQGSDTGEFESSEKEARTLTEYLKSKGYDSIELIFGASLGAVVGMLMLADASVRYKAAVFEGTPMYENARFIRLMMKTAFIKKRRKAVNMPIADVREKMKNMYGFFGECMADNFVKTSEKSLASIVEACSDFSFPQISENMQKRIFLEVGSKDINVRQNKVILKHYPNVRIKVREGYGHCMYLSEHYKEYGRLLEKYMDKAAER